MGDISSPPSNTFDFIVVGAGPAGILAATCLANSRKHPSVLLVEAGGENGALEARIDANRWLHRMIPDSNWKYMTEPQQSLNNRLIEYDRGKGLGGGSSINFACWTVPPKDDFDEIARRTGNPEWEWSQAQVRFKRIESYHADPSQLPDGASKYLRPLETDHGKDGPIKIGFPVIWEKSVTTEYDAWVAAGYEANPDHNSGNPLGVSIIASTAFRGERSTAADALVHAPGNLHILTDAEVARVNFNGKTATGITTIGGRDYYATKEVILSAGTLDTPRILMHSGIGPAAQLTKFNIPVLYDNPAIGQHMKDHHHAILSYLGAPHTSIRREYFQSKEAQEAAMKQWQTNRTGPLAEIACTLGIVYAKIPSIYTSSEFANLSANIQNYLSQPTVPSFEVIFNATTVMFDMDPNSKPAKNAFVFLLNEQSEGCVLLQSTDPATPLKFDPKFLSHPFDKRVVIEATREVLRVANSPEYAKDTIGELNTPKSTSDEDILEFWRENTASTWHMTGTVRMGQEGQEGGSGVDKDFKVHGVGHLRVADMSVVPLLVNAHTQTVAYLTGLMAGDTIVKEYGLDE